jgi:hypothetical protein
MTLPPSGGCRVGIDVPKDWVPRQPEEALRSTNMEAKSVEPLRLTDHESATACIDHLHAALKALAKLDDEVGKEALHALWPWRTRRDELGAADLFVVKRLAARIATLLVAAHREVRTAEALGGGMSPAPIRALAVQFASWCRAAATPGELSAKEVSLRGIGFLFDGDKELKRLREELTCRILTLNRQVQIRGSDRRRWPLRVYSEEPVVTGDRAGAPRNKGGRPPSAGLLERYLEIERTAESMEMTWQEACDAYQRQYGIEVKPGTVKRWHQRYRTKLSKADAA